MAFLRSVADGREYLLRDKLTVLGRDPACEVRVPSDRASRRHALVLSLEGACSIEDLESANGTIVNDQPLRQRTRLRSGDRVDVGGYVMTFHEGAPVIPLLPPLPPLASPPWPGSEKEPKSLITSTLEVSGSLRMNVAPEAKLRVVLDISQNLSRSLDLTEVLPRILESLFAVFPHAEHGLVLLTDPASGQLMPHAVRHRRGHEKDSAPISHTILKHAIKTGNAILSADVGTDERFDPSESIRQMHLRSLVCVPLLSQSGSCLGIIQLDSRDPRNRFRQEDLDILLIAGTQAARAVELAELHRERRDLEAATEIQKSFLPASRPEIEGLQFFDHYSAAFHIGGDYFDYIPLPGNRLAVAVGDVAGKGVAAALLMARVSAAARFCLASEPNVAKAVRNLNEVLMRGGRPDRFVSLVLVVLDRTTFTLTLANAGHPPPLRRRSGPARVEELGHDIVDLPLGVFARPYESVEVSFAEGDTLVLFTDGVTEARNKAGEYYGIDRLRAVIQAAPNDAPKLGEAILADVRRFADGCPPSDDLTLVCFGRVGKK